MPKIYNAEEIARHNHSKDLWIVIHGKVCDLTEFHKEHPGGEEVLLELAGKDGSKCFDSIGHSTEANMLREYYEVGEVEEGAILEIPDLTLAPKESIMTQDANLQFNKQDKKKVEDKSSYLPLIAAVIIYIALIYCIWY